MTTITAKFDEREVLSRALEALAAENVHTTRVDLLPASVQQATPSPPDTGASVAGVLGAVAVGTAGAIAVAASGGTLLVAGAAVAAVAGGAAGAMAGGVVGTLAGATTDEAAERKADAVHAAVVVSLDVQDSDASRAREIIAHKGGVLINVDPREGLGHVVHEPGAA